MVIVVIIVIVLLLIFWFKSRKRGVPPETSPVPQPPKVILPPDTEETGAAYITRYHTKVFQRRTWITGRLVSKFYGELDYVKDLQQFVRERYFDVTLYDAQIHDAVIIKNNEGPPADFSEEDVFPGHLQPNPLPCKLVYAGVEGDFVLILYDVKLARIDFDKHRLLHQEEDDLVFGVVEALISGYMLEEFEETSEEIIPIEPHETQPQAMAGLRIQPTTSAIAYQSVQPTGRTKIEKGYQWTEVRTNKTAQSAYWSKPVYVGRDNPGCWSILGWIYIFIVGFFFFMTIGGQGIAGLLIFAAIGLILAFLADFLRVFLWIVAAIFVILGIVNLSQDLTTRIKVEVPVFQKDTLTETTHTVTESNTPEKDDKPTDVDTLIIHHRIWHDYNGRRFEGDVWVKTSDVSRSALYKDHLTLPTGKATHAYDQLLDDLQLQDKGRLMGVTVLLDSIRKANSLDSIAFAEAIVSFVQDIPYAIVLDGDCDPALYNDPFTRSYLGSENAICDGFERFGINTPVEFIGGLKGDCDTRTLFLYTLFVHYGYDAAIFSSELYSHSLFGINLPINGTAYSYNNKKYVLWETTAAGVPAGIISPKVSDLNNWRISLISNNKP